MDFFWHSSSGGGAAAKAKFPVVHFALLVGINRWHGTYHAAESLWYKLITNSSCAQARGNWCKRCGESQGTVRSLCEHKHAASRPSLYTHLLFVEPGTQNFKLLELLLGIPRPNLIVPFVIGVEVVVFLAVVQLRQVSFLCFSFRLQW